MQVNGSNIDYQKAKIYKIYNPNVNNSKIYIGCTTRLLNERMKGHITAYKSQTLKKRCNSYKLFQEYGINNCVIELIEDFPCDNKIELYQKETYYMNKIKQDGYELVNKVVSYRTELEKKMIKKLSVKLYKQVHYERLKLLHKRKLMCECGTGYTYSHYARHCTSGNHINYLAKKNATNTKVD
jgi:uncharacterized protein YlzI (FlbEa/FlbD family)